MRFCLKNQSWGPLWCHPPSKPWTMGSMPSLMANTIFSSNPCHSFIFFSLKRGSHIGLVHSLAADICQGCWALARTGWWWMTTQLGQGLLHCGLASWQHEEQWVPQEELALPLRVFVLRLDLQDLLWDLRIRRRCHQWACFGWATCLVLALVRTELKGPSILDPFLLSWG